MQCPNDLRVEGCLSPRCLASATRRGFSFTGPLTTDGVAVTARPRAILFIDGSNWYHSVRAAGITGGGELNYVLIAQKLVGPGRDWTGTRYYVGRVNQKEEATLYADQRRFFSKFEAADPRNTAHFGRLETRSHTSDAAVELRGYLGGLKVRIDPKVYHDLIAISKRHTNVQVTHEKAVDVMLAVDMVMMAHRDKYDAAYLLSADGDYTPAVEAVRALGKNVYVASPSKGAQLASVATTYIPLTADWFRDCW